VRTLWVKVSSRRSGWSCTIRVSICLHCHRRLRGTSTEGLLHRAGPPLEDGLQGGRKGEWVEECSSHLHVYVQTQSHGGIEREREQEKAPAALLLVDYFGTTMVASARAVGQELKTQLEAFVGMFNPPPFKKCVHGVNQSPLENFGSLGLIALPGYALPLLHRESYPTPYIRR
jgi:hypothetical protein